jgi:hypothetical protein
MKVLKTYYVWVDINLDAQQEKDARALLNMHYTNDTECNVLKDGKFVSKYPEIEAANPKFQASHYNVARCYQRRIPVNFMEDGTLRLADNPSTPAERDAEVESEGTKIARKNRDKMNKMRKKERE